MHSEVQQQEEVKAAEDVGNEEMKVEENNEEVKQEEVKEEEPAGQIEERGEGQPDGPSDPPQNEANSPQ